jgi:microcin C transport system substrate-binding protein
MNRLSPWIIAAAAIASSFLNGCSKKNGETPSPAATSAAAPTSAAAAFPGMEADLQRTLKEQSSFYIFKTPADFEKDTQGLKWEDGSDLPSYADPAAKKGGTLNLYIPDFPGTFRTIGPDSNGSFRSFLLDYDLLALVRVYPDAPGRIAPELATSWAVDPKSATVYFRLDPDARWSDGVPFTTEDLVFNWYLFRSPVLNDPWLNDYYTKTYRSITVYDAHTFATTLKELRPDIVARAADASMAMPVLPKHFFKDFGPDWVQKYNWRIAPTTGAYTIRDEDVKRTTSITLTHVKDWWAADKPFARGRFNPDRIRLTVIRDPNKAFEAFVHGDLDVFPLTTQEWYDKLPNDSPSVASGSTVKAIFYNQIPPPDIGLWINTAKPPLDNINVRLGIFSATNMELICKQYLRGNGQVQKTYSNGYGWDINPALNPRPFDPAKAREYFARAGFTQQGADGILATPQGQRLSFTITTTHREFQDVLVILKQEALKAGLEFNVETLDETTGWEKEQEKKHDIALEAFNRGVEMFPRYWDNFSGENAYDVPYLADGSPNPARKLKTSTNNLFSLADYGLDQMIVPYDKTRTMDEVREQAAKIEQRIYDDAVWVNGWKLPFYRVGYRPWIKWPADFNPMQSMDFIQFWLMWIDQDEQKSDLEAKSQGRALPPQILTFNKYKEP